ncbi:MAG TPA: tRNA lysidine(34) synthetase TilS, partial [Candidatus Parcubacteria bacterium]|nr:tRNA lysidine(34) synthetase TilS [Candidatus Parcubacteria bacterium]
SLTPSPSPKGRGGQANENHLREIRYDFFEKIRKRKKYNLIAVAHNRDDQAETVLMRVLRGAGLQGLSSMKPKNNKIIRPLLSMSRKEILEYLKENKLKYQTDITNKDTKIFRNKIRHCLIPYLEKNYNPNIKKSLADMALVVAYDYDYLLANTERMLKRIGATTNKKNKFIFSAEKIQKLHPAIRRQCLRQVIFQIRADLTDIETCHIEEIIKIIRSKKGKTQTIKFKGLKIEKKGDKVSVVKV